MKIVVLDGYTLNPGDLSWDELERLGEVVVYDRTASDDILARAIDADIILTNKTPLSAETLRQCHNLRYVGVLATGYNVVDIKAASELGITVTNIPSYGTDGVAQFAISLLLEICSHIGHHDESVHDGEWESNLDWCFWDYPLIELAGKTMGIIGYGRIGRATGRIAKAIGMNVIAYDSHRLDEYSSDYVDLDTLLSSSDVIALHCPLFPETEGIISAKTISKMKDGVIIINNSRGPLIVEKDLADALNSGKVYAAGLDVVSTEPIHGDNPLLSAKNCIITPHISWAAKESRSRLFDIAIDNIKAFLAGQPMNVVSAAR